MLDLIKNFLIKMYQERCLKNEGNPNKLAEVVTQRLLHQIQFNMKNKLFAVIDASLTDNQLQNLMETLAMIAMKSADSNHSHFQIKGLNLNGNVELTDYSLRVLTEFVKKYQSIRVLSIERFKVSHASLNALFQALPQSRIVELNISGIPISYFCIEQLCRILQEFHGRIDLRVLHLRNTKLQDVSALKFMECVLGAGNAPAAKVKYLSMSMNTQLGFKFQSGVIKMFQDAAERAEKEDKKIHLKYLDLKFCNLSQ